MEVPKHVFGLPGGADGPLRQSKLSDRLYEQIFALIVSGELPENAKLPTEAEISARFGVSRPVVREALARLRDDGIIYSRQGSGSYVRSRPDEAVLRFTPIGSIADIQRCYEFRLDLEPGAAALAALRRDTDSIAAIEAALQSLEQILRTAELGVDADFQFHMAIAKASRNQFYAATMASLHRNVTFGMNLARNLTLTRPRARLDLVQGEHIAVLDAIRAGDPAAARQAMWLHIDNARHRVFEGQTGISGMMAAMPGSEIASGA
jgi:GntR family transcriptional repressor for pyruvate dehydrogenase complex